MLTNRLSASRRIYITIMRVLLVLAAVLTAALVVFMIVYVLSKGLPYVTWHLLSTKPSYVSGTIGILPDICNTVQILLASLLIVLPLGVGAAVYLTEYAQNKKLVAAIEYAAETLSGIPSIIYGLVGMLFFCEFLGMHSPCATATVLPGQLPVCWCRPVRALKRLLLPTFGFPASATARGAASGRLMRRPPRAAARRPSAAGRRPHR